MKFAFNSKYSHNSASSGMALPELVVAVVMLLVFSGIVLMVNVTIFRFLYPAELMSSGKLNRSNGLLIDRQELRKTMNRLANLLQQPGITRERLLGQVGSNPQIAYDFTSQTSEACVVDPVRTWNITLDPDSFARTPAGYRFCFWSTSVRESPINQLISGDDQASPGIYILQAIPEQLTTSHLSIRMLVCRPDPFC